MKNSPNNGFPKKDGDLISCPFRCSPSLELKHQVNGSPGAASQRPLQERGGGRLVQRLGKNHGKTQKKTQKRRRFFCGILGRETLARAI